MKNGINIKKALFGFVILMAVWQPAVEAKESIHDKLFWYISLYRNGEYQRTVDSLSVLLPLIANQDDYLLALEYLAYSSGMLSKIDVAKDYFKRALNKYPAMTIDTLECPPNIALIFNQVKLEKTIAKIDTARLEANASANAERKKPPVMPIVSLSGSLVAAGIGGYFLFHGIDLHQKYRAVTLEVPNAQAKMDKYISQMTTAYVESALFGGVTGGLVWLTIHLFTKPDAPKTTAGVSFVNGNPSLILSF